MKGLIVKDWNRVDFRNPAHRRVVGECLGRFLAAPLSPEFTREMAAKVAEFATSGDFPAAVSQILEKYHLTKMYDDGWRRIFDVRDFTGTAESGFDLVDVQSGLTFAKVPTGEKAKVYGMSGTKARVYFDAYGAGLAWDRKLIEDRQFWTLEDNAIQFRNKAFHNLALNHYALIEAVASAQNIAWQTPSPAALATSDATYVANRDAETIAKACETILLACDEKGYGVNAQNASFVLSCPLQLTRRLVRALGLVLQPVAGSPRALGYDVQIQPTTMYAAATSYYVILPGNKIKSGIRKNLELLNDTDILAYADMTAGWMRYGAAVGDQEQVARCAIS